MMGGHIRTFSSPADPLFFSHHAMIDRVWAMWQDCHDHENVASADITSTHYQGVISDSNSPRYDGMTRALPYKAQTQAATTATNCAKSDSSCAACVHNVDGWCEFSSERSRCDAIGSKMGHKTDDGITSRSLSPSSSSSSSPSPPTTQARATTGTIPAAASARALAPPIAERPPPSWVTRTASSRPSRRRA